MITFGFASTKAEDQPTTVDCAGPCASAELAVNRSMGSPDKAEVSGSSPHRPTKPPLTDMT